MSWSHPERLWWLLPWLLFCFAVLRQHVRSQVRLQEFLEAPAARRLAHEGRPGRRSVAFFLQAMALGWWLVAWAGPRWGAEKMKVERDALDIVFLVDCSKSMRAQDPAPDRRQVALRELTELMEKFQGNRLGLVGFAGEAYVFCPLTLDAGATELFLEQLDENAIPVPGTAIGKALQVGLSCFSKDTGSKVMILLTDGEDHHSKPLEIAKEIARQGITLYTVGVGSPEGAPIPADQPGEFIKDSQGKVVNSKLDEPLLKEMALTTGGSFIRIQKPTDNLDAIVKSVLSKERRKLESQLTVRHQHQFPIFVGLGIVSLLLGVALVPRVSTEAGR